MTSTTTTMMNPKDLARHYGVSFRPPFFKRHGGSTTTLIRSLTITLEDPGPRGDHENDNDQHLQNEQEHASDMDYHREEDPSYDQFDDEDNDDDIDYDDTFRARNERWNNSSSSSSSSSSSPRASKPSYSRQERRLFMNPKASLEERVDRLIRVELGSLHPLDIVLTSVELIREAGKRRSFEGMKYAHDVMDRIIEEKHYVNAQRSKDGSTPPPYAIVIPERTFEVLMYGWSNLCRKVPIAPQRMREVLDLMIQEAEYDETLRKERQEEGFPLPDYSNVSIRRGKDEEQQLQSDMDPATMFAGLSCQPTVGIYNTLLNGLAQASYRSIASANEAEDVLRRMERLSRGKGWHVKPNTKSFMTVITAFSRTKHPSAGERAEGILRRMIQYQEKQLESSASAQNEIDNDNDHDHPMESNRKIVTPDAMAYTAVMQAYGESDAPGSAERALMLLTEVLESSDPNLQPDAFIFAATINAFAKQAAKLNAAEARLDAAEAAEGILWLMVESLENREIKGDLVVPFNNCLIAWANANLRESPRRAEAILQRMLDPNSSIRPSNVTFNSCMQVWARAARQDPEAPKYAEDLLQLMEQTDDVEADVVSYTTLIGAYAKSSRLDKAFQARRIIEILLANLATMPLAARESISAVPFTVVLSAVASAKPSTQPTTIADNDPFGVESDGMTTEDDPYMVALKTYDEVVHDLYDLGISPDHLFFATMVDVIAAYTSSESIERRQRLERVFEDACSAGEVSSMVVQALVKACPSRDMLVGLLQVFSWPVDTVNAFPREWTRKVLPNFKKLKLAGGPNSKRKSDNRKQDNRKPDNRRPDRNRLHRLLVLDTFKCERYGSLRFIFSI
jgi:PPR repeat